MMEVLKFKQFVNENLNEGSDLNWLDTVEMSNGDIDAAQHGEVTTQMSPILKWVGVRDIDDLYIVGGTEQDEEEDTDITQDFKPKKGDWSRPLKTSAGPFGVENFILGDYNGKKAAAIDALSGSWTIYSKK